MKQDIELKQTGYGHWRVTMPYYKKEINCITTNSQAVDDYRSGEYDDLKRVNKGYKALRRELIRKHKGIA